ncbi:unnamed protein product, partial [Pylaiella littoralis]
TAQATFHSFCEHFVREMYDEHICLPTGRCQPRVMGKYERIGFPGSIGSANLTHLAWGMCLYNQARYCTGKDGNPTCTVAF